MRVSLGSLAALLLIGVGPSGSAPPKDKIAEPQLLSVFPWVGQQSTKVQAEVRGNVLAGAYAVWFEDQGLSGRVVKVEEIKTDDPPPPQEKKEKPAPLYQVSIEVQITPQADRGNHSLRLGTPPDYRARSRFE